MNGAAILDTSAYAAFKTGNEAVTSVIRGAESLALSPIVLAELYAGFHLGKQERKNLAELESFRSSPRVRVLTVTERTAWFYSRIFAALRRKARPIPTNDMWIAASAMEHGLTLITLDAHFREIDGLLCSSP